jgi:hypothetical protein
MIFVKFIIFLYTNCVSFYHPCIPLSGAALEARRIQRGFLAHQSGDFDWIRNKTTLCSQCLRGEVQKVGWCKDRGRIIKISKRCF